MSEAPILAEALRLREEFDLAFVGDRLPDVQSKESLLAIVLGGDPYALRIADLAFLERGPAPASFATGAPAFLGLAGVRGELLPLWDLAGLLGYPTRPGRPAWMVCSAETPRWGAAFGHFEGMLRVSEEELSTHGGEGPAARFTRGICRAGGLSRPILDLSLISKAIREGGK